MPFENEDGVIVKEQASSQASRGMRILSEISYVVSAIMRLPNTLKMEEPARLYSSTLVLFVVFYRDGGAMSFYVLTNSRPSCPG